MAPSPPIQNAGREPAPVSPSSIPVSRRLGHAARVTAGIVRGRFDRRGRQGLGCIGKQLSWVVWHRLVRIDRARLRN